MYPTKGFNIMSALLFIISVVLLGVLFFMFMHSNHELTLLSGVAALLLIGLLLWLIIFVVSTRQNVEFWEEMKKHKFKFLHSSRCPVCGQKNSWNSRTCKKCKAKIY